MVNVRSPALEDVVKLRTGKVDEIMDYKFYSGHLKLNFDLILAQDSDTGKLENTF